MIVKNKQRKSSSVVWEDAPTELTRTSAFVEVYGDTGTGRTSWALTAPGPIALIHAAEKLEGVVQQYATDKEIKLVDFGGVFTGSQQKVADDAGAVWDRLKAAWYDAYDWARTIVLDTHTEAWELIRLARFGGLKPSGGRVDANYGPVNAEWRSLFKHFRHQDSANVIVIGQTRDEYTESKKGGGMGQRTGRTIRAGQKEIPYMADVIVRTTRDLTDNTFTSRIEKGWWNAHVEGLELEDEMSTFPQVMGIVTETDPETWQ